MQEDLLTCHGLNDFQVNGFLAKTGFRDVMKGYACVKGNAVVLKSGYFRLLITPDFKHHAMPSSMTKADWIRLNRFRQWNMDVFIFVTREYCVPSFVKTLKGNSPIPTDAQIIENYSYQAIKDDNGEIIGWQYKPAHTALLHIRGTKFTLYDVNNNDQADLEAIENSFAPKFFHVVSRYVLPRICKNLSLKIGRIRKNYGIAKCFFPKA